jgi:hypothetical protein
VSEELAKPESLEKPTQPVGYCSPPEATRFKKGVSGNPKGRPKGSVNVITALTKALREKVVINENGRRRTVTKLEAAIKQLVNKAATGDLRALRHLTELAQDAETQQSLSNTEKEALNELDREVMQGILQRFQMSEEANPSSEKES